MNDNIFKIWGSRRRILKNDLVEVDHLIIKKDTFCSMHSHKHKSNKFYIISGKCMIKSDYGEVILNANEYFDVHPPLKHQFIALEDTVMVEVAYIKIDPEDIDRIKQGGKIINKEYISQDEITFCDSGNIALPTSPIQYKCIKCGTVWSAGDNVPICKGK